MSTGSSDSQPSPRSSSNSTSSYGPCPAAAAGRFRAAVRSLQGVFSERIHELLERLTALRSWIEACMDFPDEEIDLLTDQRLNAQIGELVVAEVELAEIGDQIILPVVAQRSL